MPGVLEESPGLGPICSDRHSNPLELSARQTSFVKREANRLLAQSSREMCR